MVNVIMVLTNVVIVLALLLASLMMVELMRALESFLAGFILHFEVIDPC